MATIESTERNPICIPPIRLRSILTDLTPYMFLLCLALLAYANLGLLDEGLFYWSDLNFPISPDLALNRALYAWANVGTGFPTQASGLPYYLYIYVLAQLAPLWVVNHAVFVLATAARGWTMFFMLTTILGGRGREMVVASFLGAVFFEVITLDVYVIPSTGLLLSSLPLMFALYNKGLRAVVKNKSSCLLYLPLLGITAFALVWSHIYLALNLFLVLFLTIYYLALRWRHARVILLYSGGVLAMIVLANSYFIVPTFMNYQAAVQWVGRVQSVVHTPENLYSFGKSVGLVELLRTAPRATFDEYYTSPHIVAIGFILTTITFIGTFVRKDFYSLFFALLLIFWSAVIGSLTYPLTRELYVLVYSLLPGILANPTYFIHMTAFGLASLLGLSVYGLSVQLSRHYNWMSRDVAKLSFAVIIFGLIMINSAPVFSGTGLRPDTTASLPEPYFGLARYLEQQAGTQYRVLYLPAIGDFRSYLWTKPWIFPVTGYWAAPFDQDLIVSPIIGGDRVIPNPSEAESKAINQLLTGNARYALADLGALSVRYVLVHKDIRGQDVSSILRMLEGQTDLVTKNIDNQYFTLYEINETLTRPLAYVCKIRPSANISSLGATDAQEMCFSDSKGRFVTTLSDGSSAKGWRVWGPASGKLSLDGLDRVNGSFSIRENVITQGNAGLRYDMDVPQNMSTAEYLVFYAKSNGSRGPGWVYLTDRDGNERIWGPLNLSTSWRLYRYPIYANYQQPGSFNPNYVLSFSFYQNMNAGGTIWVDTPFVYHRNGSFSEHSEPCCKSYRVVYQNPTRLDVQIQEQGRFLLIFNTQFDLGWVAQAHEKIDVERVKLGDVGNGWLITSFDTTTISLFYRPQMYFELGRSLTAAIVFASVTAVLSFGVTRTSFRRNLAKRGPV